MGKFESRGSDKNNRIFKIILLVLLIIIIILLLMRSCGSSGGPVLEPDYNLVEQDENAETIPGDTGEKAQVTQGGGSMSLIYSDQISVNLSTGKVGLYYQNPSESSHSIVVQIIIERSEDQYLVAESGGLSPGYMLTELTAEKDLKLTAGVYEGVMRLLFFDPDTGERAVVDTNIPVDITVQ